jgi:hypothetical protein
VRMEIVGRASVGRIDWIEMFVELESAIDYEKKGREVVEKGGRTD